MLRATCGRGSRRLRERARLRLEALEARALLSVFTVDRLTDFGEGQGLVGDLRYCLTQALDGDIVTFGVTGTVNLTQALPDLSRNVSIEGPGPALVTVENSTVNHFRVFYVDAGARVKITGLTVTRGSASVEGGGIDNAGELTLSNCAVLQNDVFQNGSDTRGAGIYNSGSLSVRGCTVANNNVDISGGPGRGAGIYNAGQMALSSSTVSGNSFTTFDGSTFGAGVYNAGTLTVDNSTLSGNGTSYFSDGGGIYNAGCLRVLHSTITNNYAEERGGGIFGPVLEMRNTILAGNDSSTGIDLSGTVANSGYNLIGNSQGGSGFSETDLLDLDPRLAPLQDNGGPTLTHALLPGSPAIDAGENTGAPPYDQRGPGFPRIVNGIIDIGAYEVQEEGQRLGLALPPSAPALKPVTDRAISSTLPASFLSPFPSTDHEPESFRVPTASPPIVSQTGAVPGSKAVPFAVTGRGAPQAPVAAADDFWIGDGALAEPVSSGWNVPAGV